MNIEFFINSLDNDQKETLKNMLVHDYFQGDYEYIEKILKNFRLDTEEMNELAVEGNTTLIKKFKERNNIHD